MPLNKIFNIFNFIYLINILIFIYLFFLIFFLKSGLRICYDIFEKVGFVEMEFLSLYTELIQIFFLKNGIQQNSKIFHYENECIINPEKTGQSLIHIVR